MRLIYSPPAGKGRQRIVGTVIADDSDQYCLVRLVASLAENAGGTNSPRVEIWIGLSRSCMAPAVFRRTWHAAQEPAPEWQTTRLGDLGKEMWILATEKLGAIGYRDTDVWPGKPWPEWPTTIWDPRVILPDDPRWKLPRSNQRTTAIPKMFARRNVCPSDEVWCIDALILSMALRD